MQILGLILFLIPIAILFVLTVRIEGWRVACRAWGAGLIMAGCFYTGMQLMASPGL